MIVKVSKHFYLVIVRVLLQNYCYTAQLNILKMFRALIYEKLIKGSRHIMHIVQEKRFLFGKIDSYPSI